MSPETIWYDKFHKWHNLCYKGGASSRDAFSTKHDNILSYAIKRGNHTFNFNDVINSICYRNRSINRRKNTKKYYLKSGTRYYIEREG